MAKTTVTPLPEYSAPSLTLGGRAEVLHPPDNRRMDAKTRALWAGISLALRTIAGGINAAAKAIDAFIA